MLKTIALVSMTVDHIGFCFFADNRIPLFAVFGFEITLYSLARAIGRLAFPIYAFLVSEGMKHTRDRKKYIQTLLFFAVISEIPWNLVHTGELFYSRQNVYFTLFLGAAGIYVLNEFGSTPVKQVFLLLYMVYAALYANIDYGLKGFALILLFYVLPENKLALAVTGTALMDNFRYLGGLAFIPISMYNGKRGFINSKILKYAFYLYYPVHFLLLYFIKNATVGYAQL